MTPKEKASESTDEIVELMLKSSNHNPYKGFLDEKENTIAAIELAKLCRDFADKGHTDEAMDIPVEKWDEVIVKLSEIQNQYN